MIPWDSDTALNQINENVTLRDANSTPARLFLKLMTNADFRQLVADRLYRHLEQSQGVLTSTACIQRYSELANVVDLAIMGESARWGAYAEKIYPQITFTAPNKAQPAYLHSRSMPAADSNPTPWKKTQVGRDHSPCDALLARGQTAVMVKCHW